jgi:thiamine kinase-like enzyme
MVDAVPPGASLIEPPDWALRRVPGLADGRPPRCLRRLGGGTVNEVFQIVSGEGAFVLRLDGAAWRRPGVDRVRELTLHRIAAAAGIAPGIVAADPASQGLLVTRYYPGRTWQASDYDNVSRLRRLGERLAILHRQPAPPIARFDPLAVGLSYVRRLDAQRAAATGPVIQRLTRLCTELLSSDVSPSVVHGDLWEGNLLEDSTPDSPLWLLDWEYAQVTEPLMDIAGLLAYYPIAQRHQTELMAAADMAACRPDVLADRVDIYRILSWLWRLARGEEAGTIDLR